MRAVLLKAPRVLEVAEVEDPRVPPGWALVRTELAGICGTDKAFYTGTYRLFKTPLIPGHEVVGRVVDGGAPELLGKRVVAEINFSCGRCDYCRSGLYTHCPYKKTLGIDYDGGMADYFVAPLEALHVYPGEPETGLFAEPLAAVLRALSLRPPRPGDRVAIVGTGNLAYLTAQALRELYDVEVHLVARRGSAKAGFYSGIVDEVRPVEEAPDSFYDAVFEASGDPSALDLAVRITKPRGVIHLKSTPGSLAGFNSTLAVVKEVEIVPSRCGTFREFRLAVELLSRGRIKPRLDRVYPLVDAREAFEEALKPSYFKIALRP